MKLGLLLGTLLMAIGTHAFAADTISGQAVIAPQGASLRNCPDVSCKGDQVAMPGDQLLALDTNGDWVKVVLLDVPGTSEPFSGWVKLDSVKSIGPGDGLIIAKVKQMAQDQDAVLECVLTAKPSTGAANDKCISKYRATRGVK